MYDKLESIVLRGMKDAMKSLMGIPNLCFHSNVESSLLLLVSFQLRKLVRVLEHQTTASTYGLLAKSSPTKLVPFFSMTESLMSALYPLIFLPDIGRESSALVPDYEFHRKLLAGMLHISHLGPFRPNERSRV